MAGYGVPRLAEANAYIWTRHERPSRPTLNPMRILHTRIIAGLILAATLLAAPSAQADSWRRVDETPGCVDRSEFRYGGFDNFEIETKAEVRSFWRQRGFRLPLGHTEPVVEGVSYDDPERYKRFGYRACGGAKVRVVYERPRALHPRSWWWVHMSYTRADAQTARTAR